MTSVTAPLSTHLASTDQAAATVPSWAEVLREEKQQPYFQEIIATIDKERSEGQLIYPPNKDMFRALKLTPFEDVRVVILGQDPYHGPGQAHGLCFSVQRPVPAPPSLKNIFKELHSDLGCTVPGHGDLSSWASQGVLLLNASLSVRAGSPQSHQHLGWARFTDSIVAALSHYHEGLVFLLWGASARKKASVVDGKKHHLLTAPHPSPLSAHRGFFGCGHFSKANELLEHQGKQPIDWQLA